MKNLYVEFATLGQSVTGVQGGISGLANGQASLGETQSRILRSLEGLREDVRSVLENRMRPISDPPAGTPGLLETALKRNVELEELLAAYREHDSACKAFPASQTGPQ